MGCCVLTGENKVAEIRLRVSHKTALARSRQDTLFTMMAAKQHFEQEEKSLNDFIKISSLAVKQGFLKSPLNVKLINIQEQTWAVIF